MGMRQKGEIKKLTDRGFGFITQSDGSKDVFFHKSGLDGVEFDQLREGLEVTYEVESGEKGLKAVGVKVER